MKRAVKQRNFSLWLEDNSRPVVEPPLVIDPPVPTEAPVARSCLDCISYVPPRCSDPLHGYIDNPDIPPCDGVDWLLRPGNRRGHGRPFPMKCSWDKWGDRLVTKCNNPEPTDDHTGCVHCGALKPTAV